MEEQALDVSRRLNVRPDDLGKRIDGLLREIQDLKSRRAQEDSGQTERELADLKSAVREGSKGRFVTGMVTVPDAKSLREAGDKVAALVRPGAGVVWSEFEDRMAAQIVVSPELAKNGVSAKMLAAALSERLGVRGGGKDTSAQIGGKPDKPLPAVVEETWSVLTQHMEAKS
jgi:alanyl-tRNA synthetase